MVLRGRGAQVDLRIPVTLPALTMTGREATTEECLQAWKSLWSSHKKKRARGQREYIPGREKDEELSKIQMHIVAEGSEQSSGSYFVLRAVAAD